MNKRTNPFGITKLSAPLITALGVSVGAVLSIFLALGLFNGNNSLAKSVDRSENYVSKKLENNVDHSSFHRESRNETEPGNSNDAKRAPASSDITSSHTASATNKNQYIAASGGRSFNRTEINKGLVEKTRIHAGNTLPDYSHDDQADDATPGNNAPVAQAQLVKTNEGEGVAIYLTARDIDGDSLQYGVVSEPSHGTLTGNAPNLTYTPDEGFSGKDSFTFIANDGLKNSNAGVVRILVIGENSRPFAKNLSLETAVNTSTAVTLKGGDLDGDELTYSVLTEPSHGELSGTPPQLVYTPAEDFTGNDSFTYIASDGEQDSGTATVSINVIPGNQPPLAVAVRDLSNDGRVILNGSSSVDGDGNITEYSWSQISGAPVTLSDANTPVASFIPPTAKPGEKSPSKLDIMTFKLTVTDDQGSSAEDTLSVLLTGETVEAAAWVGTRGTGVTFPANAEGMEFVRSTDGHCDLANYRTCESGQLDIIGSQIVNDTSLTIDQPAFWWLYDGNMASNPTAVEKSANLDLPELAGHQIVNWNGQLWIIGGKNRDGSTSGIWNSTDGVNWNEATENAEFSSRSDHQVVVWNNALWLVGGRDASGKVLNDVWTSGNGLSWTRVDVPGEFTPQANGRLVVWNNALWMIGGDSSKVWTSLDGGTWSVHAENSELLRNNPEVVVLNDALWVLGGSKDGAPTNDILKSSDGGTTWEKITATNSFPARDNFQASITRDGLWVLGGDLGGGKLANDVWFSKDGVNWSEVTNGASFQARSNHQVVNMNNNLIMIGGINKDSKFLNDVWGSDDGETWLSGMKVTFKFP